jgi:hypothetical protein
VPAVSRAPPSAIHAGTAASAVSLCGVGAASMRRSIRSDVTAPTSSTSPRSRSFHDSFYGNTAES